MSEEGKAKGLACVSESEVDEQLKKRPLSATLLNLKWLADKFRRKEALKAKVSGGDYTVNSDSIAKSLLNED